MTKTKYYPLREDEANLLDDALNELEHKTQRQYRRKGKDRPAFGREWTHKQAMLRLKELRHKLQSTLYAPDFDYDSSEGFLRGFHSVLEPAHERMGGIMPFTLEHARQTWLSECQPPDRTERELVMIEAMGWFQGVSQAHSFLDAYDEPYYEQAR